MRGIFLFLTFLAISIFPIYADYSQYLNQLSPEEEKAGYDLLFNGKDMDNWHIYRQNEVNDAWFVTSEGVLGERIENTQGSFDDVILSDTKYMNLDLKVDIQSYNKGNSGIFVRYEEDATRAWTNRSGPEMQICGPGNSDCIKPENQMGACYDMFPVREEVRDTWENPSGEWNQFRIIVFDSNYVHYGNGIKLLEYKIGTPEFIAAYNRSKYVSDGNNGNYYDIHEGSVLLQHHTEPGMTFRNIKVKPLIVHPFLQNFKDGWPDALPQSFVLGKPGCTDSLADNYDSTAIVDDSSCVTIGVSDPKQFKHLKISTSGGFGGPVNISVPFDHTSISICTIQGSKVSFEKHETGVYSIGNKHTAKVFVVRLGIAGRFINRLVVIP
ncbi:MAG: DUF1080 domain-containing protein [Fibrobacteria bacterium]|nr:DUF1080 domain-containing protein [Fibrobacteria bacterium]